MATTKQAPTARTVNPADSIGWLTAKAGGYIDNMAKNRVWAWAISPESKIFVHQSYPVHLMQRSPEAILSSLRNVTQGVATKAYAQGVVGATSSVVDSKTLNFTTATRCFGLRVTIFDSSLNFRPGWYHVGVNDGSAGSSGSILGEVFIRANRPPIEFMMLSIQSGGGQASPIAMANPYCTLFNDSCIIIASATTTTVGFAIESLNERDLPH